MPAKITKVDGKYRVSTPSQTHAFGTSKAKAERQARLLRAVDHGWKPTGEPAKESVHDTALRIVNKLLEAPRDDVGRVPIPASGKEYARIHGMGGLQKKQQLYINMARDLGNRGKPTYGFKDYEGSAYTGPKHETLDELVPPVEEGSGNAPVNQPLERHRTEKTTLHGGKYGKHVDPKGKTGGKFTFPKNYKVGHAIKS